MPKPKTKRITTSEIKDAMERKWCAPEHALILEVSDGTGSRRGRIADAIIMGLWPSRGINLDGVEIKTQRSDWLRELKDPQKAESISRFCDHWWIHATPDVVREEELPEGWGLRVYDGRIWKTIREATLRDSQPVDRDFLAGILRRLDQMIEKRAETMVDARLADAEAKMEQRIEALAIQRTRKVDALAKVAEAFEEHTGLDLMELATSGKAQNAARITAAFLKHDLDNQWGGFASLLMTMRNTADDLHDTLEQIGLEPPCEKTRKTHRRDRIKRRDQMAKQRKAASM